jgi:hypothetical protein
MIDSEYMEPLWATNLLRIEVRSCEKNTSKTNTSLKNPPLLSCGNNSDARSYTYIVAIQVAYTHKRLCKITATKRYTFSPKIVLRIHRNVGYTGSLEKSIDA